MTHPEPWIAWEDGVPDDQHWFTGHTNGIPDAELHQRDLADIMRLLGTREIVWAHRLTQTPPYRDAGAIELEIRVRQVRNGERKADPPLTLRDQLERAERRVEMLRRRLNDQEPGAPVQRENRVETRERMPLYDTVQKHSRATRERP